MIVTVAWAVPSIVPVEDPHRRVDLGERPALREVLEPRAAVWLNDGGPEDLERARAWAAEQEHPTRVDSWPPDHRDPLGAARALLSMTRERASEIVAAWSASRPPGSLNPTPEEVRNRTGATWGEWSAAHHVLLGLEP